MRGHLAPASSASMSAIAVALGQQVQLLFLRRLERLAAFDDRRTCPDTPKSAMALLRRPVKRSSTEPVLQYRAPTLLRKFRRRFIS